MAQHDYNIANQSGSAFRADLNNALLAIATVNSGSSAPSTTYAYQLWADTSAGVLKMRNAANSAWVTLFQLDGEWSTLAVENGTAAAPSIYFKDSGTDTGLYSPGADQVAISTGGSGRLFVTSAGLVGIGTSAPGSVLAAKGPIASTSNWGNLGITSEFPINASGRIYTGLLLQDSGTSGSAGVGFEYDGTGYKLHLATAASTSSGLSTRLTIDRSGNVGIGTTSPQNSLDVVAIGARAGVNGCALHTSDNTNSRFYIGHDTGNRTNLVVDSGNNLTFGQTNGSTYSERMRLDTSGRLLVGTSSSRVVGNQARTTQLESAAAETGQSIVVNSNAQFDAPALVFGKSRGTTLGSNTIVQNNDVLSYIQFCGADGTDMATRAAEIVCAVDGTPGADDMPGRLVFSTTADGASSPVERLRIASNGNVYIGGGTSFGSGGWTTQNNGEQVNQYSQTSDVRTLYGWFTNNNGTNTSVAYVQSDGKIFARTTTLQAISSERRLKENIAPLNADTAWETIKSVPFYSYNFIGADPSNVLYGPMADEVPDEMRVATSQSDDVGVIHTYDNGMLQARLYVALQAALNKIETLEAKVAALESA